MAVQTGVNDVTIYVFDSGPLIDLFRHYYPSRFPSLWEHLRRSFRRSEALLTVETKNRQNNHKAEAQCSTWC